jgi:hypothetical protein
MDVLNEFMAGEDRVVCFGRWGGRGQMGVIRPKGRRLAYSVVGSGQTKVVLCKSHFEIFESIPYSNPNAFAVSQMSCLSCHLFCLR